MTQTTDPNAERHGIVLPERAYDLLKDLDTIALPALAASAGGALTLYRVDEQIITLVVGTIAIIITLIGILLKISNVQYSANAKLAAIKAAAIVSPSISVSPDNATKLRITETVTGPGIAADPNTVVVDAPSQ